METNVFLGKPTFDPAFEEDLALVVRLGFPDSNKSKQPQPVKLALVIDNSGSMEGKKIELVKDAARHIVQWLCRRDFFTLVTFETLVKTVISFCPLQEKPLILEMINKIPTGNNTNLSGGWCQGITELLSHTSHGERLHLILLTDGKANEGVVKPEKLFQLGKEAFAKGIVTTTIGFGNDFDEKLLTGIAEKSSGRSYYVENPEDIGAAFQSEFGAMQNLSAQNLKLTLKMEHGVRLREAYGYSPETVGEGIYEISLGDGREAEAINCIFRLRAENSQNSLPSKLGEIKISGVAVGDSLDIINQTQQISWVSSETEAIESLVNEELWLAESSKKKLSALDLFETGRLGEALDLLRIHAESGSKLGNTALVVQERENLLNLSRKIKSGELNSNTRKTSRFEASAQARGQGDYRRGKGENLLEKTFSPARPEESLVFSEECASRLKEVNYSDEVISTVRTVLAELLTNAIEHGCKNNPSGKALAICKISESCAWIKVEDNGPGFNVDQVFENCEKQSNSTTERGRGLILAKKLSFRLSFADQGRQVEAVIMNKRGGSTEFRSIKAPGIRIQGNIVSVTIIGALDMWNIGEYKEKISRLLDHGFLTIILDLSELNYIDSTGLGFFVSSMQKINNNGGIFALAEPNTHIQRILDLIKFGATCPIFPSVQEALKVLKPSRTFLVESAENPSQN